MNWVRNDDCAKDKAVSGLWEKKERQSHCGSAFFMNISFANPYPSTFSRREDLGEVENQSMSLFGPV
jgi:hypothetical protein